MAQGKRVVAVSALEALARAATNAEHTIAAWMDAQRGEVFAALYSPDGRDLLIPAVSAPPRAVLDAWADVALRRHDDLHWRRRDRASGRSPAGNRQVRSASSLHRRSPASSDKSPWKIRDAPICRMRSCRFTCASRTRSSPARAARQALTISMDERARVLDLTPAGKRRARRGRGARSRVVHQPLVARHARPRPAQHRCRPRVRPAQLQSGSCWRFAPAGSSPTNCTSIRSPCKRRRGAAASRPGCCDLSSRKRPPPAPRRATLEVRRSNEAALSLYAEARVRGPGDQAEILLPAGRRRPRFSGAKNSAFWIPIRNLEAAAGLW